MGTVPETTIRPDAAATGAAFVADSRWIRRSPRDREPDLRLVCFPYAGSGASLFRTWASLLPGSIEVIAVQPPGREDRSRERPPADLRPLVRSCAVALRPYCTGRLAFYGHCAGALLAYEVAHELGGRFGHWPDRLIAAAQPAPHAGPAGRPLHELADDLLLDEVCRRGGVPAAVLNRPEILTYLTPLIRADFTLWERYRYTARPPLPCPVTVVRGSADELVDPDLALAWGDHTTAGCTLREVEGGHYFINEMSARTMRVLADVLRG